MSTEVLKGGVSRLVKVGGAAITDKSGVEVLRADALATVAKHVAKGMAKGGATIVVHGAGSFGHPQAKAGGVKDGWSVQSDVQERKAVQMAACATKLSVNQLSNHVVAALTAAGVPAFGVSPSNTVTFARASDSKSDSALEFNSLLSHISQLLVLGFVPVVHGDVVLDSVQGVRILSGDLLMEVLASRFQPRVCVFLTDVDGVFTHHPSTTGASLIRRIHVNSDGSTRLLLDHEVGTKSDAAADTTMNQSVSDVTGGMAGKIASAVKIALYVKNLDVRIVRSGTQDALDAILGLPATTCTWVRHEDKPS